MLTEVRGVPPEVAANSLVPVELDERLTVSAVVEALPNASRSCTVIGPNVGLLDAAPDTVPLVKISWAAGPAVMLSCWVAEVRPVTAAVIVGVPILESP